MFALTLINLPLHMNDETYIAHLRHARAHIEAELGELQAQTVGFGWHHVTIAIRGSYEPINGSRSCKAQGRIQQAEQVDHIEVW